MAKIVSTEIIDFLKKKIPMTYDMESQDIVYDTSDIYYKIYKCISDLVKENIKLGGEKNENK